MRLWHLKTDCIPTFSRIRKRWEYIKLCYKSLTFNVYGDKFDVVFEPIMCIVDFATGIFGVVFVTLVVALVSAVVIIYYMDVIPFLYESRNYYYASLVVFYGHYLLALISFHYYKAVRTHPGKPPSDMSERTVTTVCKRCILPKPPRTHHCSVCKTCVLKMDHHCPWVNNCVGHFNHRYFILFCVFMWLGTVYVSTTAWPLFRDCFDVMSKTRYTKNQVYSWVGYNGTQDTSEPSFAELVQRRNEDLCIGKSPSFKTRIIFLWLLCSAVIFSLGLLTTMHLKLVSTGQTTIEQLINKKEKNRLKKKGQKFVNPYNYGVKNNWAKLLRFNSIKTFIKYVVLPIPRLPEGSGLEWQQSSKVL